MCMVDSAGVGSDLVQDYRVLGGRVVRPRAKISLHELLVRQVLERFHPVVHDGREDRLLRCSCCLEDCGVDTLPNMF